MEWIWWIGGIVLVLLVLFLVVLMSSVHIQFYVSHRSGDETVLLDIRGIYGLVRYRYAVPVMRWTMHGLHVQTEQFNRNQASKQDDNELTINRERVERFFEATRALLAHTSELMQWVRKMLRSMSCTSFQWKTDVGLGDAPETAILTGTVWGIKSSIAGYVFRFVTLQTMPQLQVVPRYNTYHFTTEAEGMLHVKLYRVFFACIELLFRILRVKGGFRTWRNLFLRRKASAS